MVCHHTADCRSGTHIFSCSYQHKDAKERPFVISSFRLNLTLASVSAMCCPYVSFKRDSTRVPPLSTLRVNTLPQDTNTFTKQLWTPPSAPNEPGPQYVFLRERGTGGQSCRVSREKGKIGKRLPIHAWGRENVKDIHERSIGRYWVLPSRYSALKIDGE